MNAFKEGFIGLEEVLSNSEMAERNHLNDPDRAYAFLSNHTVSDDATSQVDLKKLRRKVDWYIVPVMFLCYTMQFIDKVSLNVRCLYRRSMQCSR